MSRVPVLLLALLLLGACGKKPEVFTVDVMNGMTPVKSQGRSQLCWAYAMLAAIETEHIMRGDSVNLSPAYVEKMLQQEPGAPASGRGMGATLINMIQKHGLVAHDAYRQCLPDVPVPRWAFMLGAQYTPLEFAHSVCAPDEYLFLASDRRQPWGADVVLDVPDNWEHNRFLNVPIDTLLLRTERAVRQGHGVCWEGDTSERGFDFAGGVARTTLLMGRTTDDHCMAIVGLGHDSKGRPYFLMKNSWGKGNALGGLMFLSFDYFRRKTIAVYMTRDAYAGRAQSGAAARARKYK